MLFHKSQLFNVWVYKEVKQLVADFVKADKLFTTRHFVEEFNADWNCMYNIQDIHRSVLNKVNSNKFELIEIEVNNCKLNKIVLRFETKTQNDLVIVLRKDNNRLRYITSWVNRRYDNHSTIDLKKYESEKSLKMSWLLN